MSKGSPHRRPLPPISLPEPRSADEARDHEIFHHKRAAVLKIWEIAHLYDISPVHVYRIYDRVCYKYGVGLESASPEFRRLLEIKST